MREPTGNEFMKSAMSATFHAAMGAALMLLVAPPCARAAGDSKLSLTSFVQSVMRSDDTIATRRLDLSLAETDIDVARGGFEPVAFIQGRQDESNIQNTAQQRAQYGNLSVYDAKTTEMKTGIATHVFTGTDVEIAYKVDRYRNNLQPPDVAGKEYRSTPAITITQPLIRGAGIAVNRAPITIAEHDMQIASQALRQTVQQRLMDAVGAYISAQEATERVRLGKASLDIAETMLKSSERLVSAGLRGAGAVVEAQTVRDIHKVQLGRARQDLNDARNTMRMLLLADGSADNAAPAATSIGVVDPISQRELKIPANDVLRSAAFQNRPETRMADLRVEREKLRIMVAENQLKPQLDLNASYDFDGLSTSPRSSLDLALRGPHRTWGVGIELRVPLQGNIRAQAQLSAAQMRKGQASTAALAARRRLANEVEATVRAATLAIDQLADQRRLVKSQEELLRFAQSQTDSGRLSSLELLRRQLELRREEEQLLTRRSAVVRASYALAFSGGTLAAELGVE